MIAFIDISMPLTFVLPQENLVSKRVHSQRIELQCQIC